MWGKRSLVGSHANENSCLTLAYYSSFGPFCVHRACVLCACLGECDFSRCNHVVSVWFLLTLQGQRLSVATSGEHKGDSITEPKEIANDSWRLQFRNSGAASACSFFGGTCLKKHMLQMRSGGSLVRFSIEYDIS